jgi:hypothetical protein
MLLGEMFARLVGDYRGRYEVAMISELSPENVLAKFLGGATSLVSRSFHVLRDVRDSYRVEIAGDFESYFQRRFKGKTRKRIRWQLRSLEKEFPGTVTTRVYTRVDEVADFLRDAEAVARRSYQWREGFDVVRATPSEWRKLTFLAERKQMRGYILFLGGTPSTYCLGTVHARKFSFDITGYDEQFANLSVGTALLYWVLEDLFATAVADELDFGGGPAEYKRLFATSNPSTIYASLYCRDLYPQLLRGLDNTCRWLAKTCKPWAKKLVGRRRGKPTATKEEASNSEAPATQPEPISEQVGEVHTETVECRR